MTSLPTRILLAAALLGGAAAAPASAATVRHVEAGGTATAGCTVDAPCGKLSDAVAAAAPGDTLRIGPGDFDFPGAVYKPLKFEGAGTSKTLVKGMAIAADSLLRDLRLRHNAVALSVAGDPHVRVEDVALEGATWACWSAAATCTRTGSSSRARSRARTASSSTASRASCTTSR